MKISILNLKIIKNGFLANKPVNFNDYIGKIAIKSFRIINPNQSGAVESLSVSVLIRFSIFIVVDSTGFDVDYTGIDDDFTYIIVEIKLFVCQKTIFDDF